MSMTATAAPMMIHAVATAPASSFRARAVSPLLTQKSKSVLRTARAIGVVRAASNPNGKSGVESAAQGMGYDTDEGLFGFTPFAELWVGRSAMMGFTVGLAEELWTGDGILAQIGIATPNPIVTVILALGLFGGSAYGATQTLAKAQDGEMSYAQFKRYVKFFGADGDKVAESLSIDLKKMEAKGQFGFMDPDNMAAIAAARGENPADRVLSMEDTAAAAAAASKKKKVTSTMDPAAAFDIDYMGPPLGGVGAGAGGKPASVSSETAFALDIEINNGRWAMIGFALAVGIESASGNGIVGQLIGYAKMTGVLGPDSGF